MAGRSGEKQYLIRQSFDRGVVRDTARHAVPGNGVYDALDFLVDRPGVVYKRGGSAFQSSELGDETSIIGVMAPEFLGDPRVLVIASDGSDSNLYDVTTDTAATAVAVTAVPSENPPLYFDKVILTDGFTGTAPQKAYIDTAVVTVADLGGAPPAGRVSCVHLDYLVLANSPDNPNRIWFSPVPVLEPPTYTILTATAGTPGTLAIAGDHTAEFYPLAGDVPAAVFHVQGSTGNDGYYSVVSSLYDGTNTVITVDTLPDGTDDGTLGISWDVFNAYVDAAGPVTGLASVAGILIVLMRGTSQRILGSVPFGFEGENMELQPLDAVGCIDARSIVQMNGLLYFANEHGIYETNGAAAESITSKRDGTGIGSEWAREMEGFAPALGAVVCAGVWLNKWLFVTIRHATEDETAGARYQWLYYQPSGAWTRLSDGVTADMYATRFAPSGELYAACGDLDDPVRLLRLSPLLNPSSDNQADANGEAVEPLLEVPFGDTSVLKEFQSGRLTYRLVESDGTTETVTLTYNGANAVTATVADPVAGQDYTLYANDFAVTDTDTAGAGPLTLTLSLTGQGLVAGDVFDVFVSADSGGDPVAAGVFVYGAAGAAQDDAIFTRDRLVISATFTGEVGRTYTLNVVDDTNGLTTSSPVDGTGGRQPISVTLAAAPTAGAGQPVKQFFYAYVQSDLGYPAGLSAPIALFDPLAPSLIVSTAPGLNAAVFTDRDVAGPTDGARTPFNITLDNEQAYSVRVTQTGESAQTEIYAVDSDVRIHEPGITGGQ